MRISVITATYNSGRTIGDTLESVLRQTYKDVELIVVDGASRDDTMDVVRRYEPRFGGRLHWTSEPDRGIYDAMNKGIARATGDVIGILNSDDFYTSDTVLERVAEAMDTTYRVAADFENLLRLIYVNRIRTRYLPVDFVTMRTGGASTSGLSSHRQIMRDHLRALRSNGVWSCTPLLGLRYIYKIWEVGMSKLRHKK